MLFDILYKMVLNFGYKIFKYGVTIEMKVVEHSIFLLNVFVALTLESVAEILKRGHPSESY